MMDVDFDFIPRRWPICVESAMSFKSEPMSDVFLRKRVENKLEGGTTTVCLFTHQVNENQSSLDQKSKKLYENI